MKKNGKNLKPHDGNEAVFSNIKWELKLINTLWSIHIIRNKNVIDNAVF